MPALLVSTMPSGSIRVTVASLYSFPVIVFEAASTLEIPFFVRTVRNQMRSHAVFVVIAAAIASSFALIGCRRGVAVAQVDPNGPVEVAIPEHGAYTGAFMDFGDAEDD